MSANQVVHLALCLEEAESRRSTTAGASKQTRGWIRRNAANGTRCTISRVLKIHVSSQDKLECQKMLLSRVKSDFMFDAPNSAHFSALLLVCLNGTHQMDFYLVSAQMTQIWCC